MNNIYTFLYFSGVISGLFLQWSNILPFGLGFSVGLMTRNVFDIDIDLQNVTNTVKNIAMQYMDKLQHLNIQPKQ